MSATRPSGAHEEVAGKCESRQEEDRFILLGFSAKLRMLIVCHAYREDDEVIRIISARKATPNERKQYGRYV
ncbi:MAG: BrnT family toxin [Planctomycetota bacterium]